MPAADRNAIVIDHEILEDHRRQRIAGTGLGGDVETLQRRRQVSDLRDVLFDLGGLRVEVAARDHPHILRSSSTSRSSTRPLTTPASLLSRAAKSLSSSPNSSPFALRNRNFMPLMASRLSNRTRSVSAVNAGFLTP